MQHYVDMGVGAVIGLVWGLAIAWIVIGVQRRRYDKKQNEKLAELVEMEAADEWVPPKKSDCMRFSMNLDQDTIEKVRRMSILHNFEYFSMVFRRAVDITFRIDQVIPNGGTITIIDENGVAIGLFIGKTRPEDQK